MTEVDGSVRSAWEARCKAGGLRLTAPRQAILAALLEQNSADDAVALLTAAQRHYPATRVGTVYRFLRELEQLHLAQALAQPHGRTHWQLRPLPEADAHASGDIQPMLAQLKDFLSELEQLDLADRQLPTDTAGATIAPTLQLMQRVADRLGYRLTSNHS